MKIDVHDSLEAVGADAWDALHAESRLRSPFLTWSWQQHWVDVFAQGRRLEVRRVIDDAGRLVALLPLVETAPERWLLVGGADVSDYLDLLVARDREAEAWSALLAARSPDATWELHSVPAASPTVTLLPELAASAGVTVSAVIEERCPILGLPESWDALLASLSGKHRHEISRKLRRFQREAPEGHISWAATPAEIDARLDDFLALHRRSREGKAKFMDDRMERFFRRVIAARAATGGARLALLDLPGGPIASFVTIEWDDTVGLYNSGFDPERASLSPGVVLLSYVIQDAIARRRPRFDFLRGEERYKFEFGPVSEAVHAVTIGGRP